MRCVTIHSGWIRLASASGSSSCSSRWTDVSGDRLITATLSTAPTPREVRDFLCEYFGIDIDETYGMTETGGTVCIGDRIHRASVIDYRLRDVPELESGIDLVRQIYLYGNSQRPYLLAVVVPDFEAAEARLGPEPDAGDVHDLVLECCRRRRAG
jgi:long-subunit acyl-CoA synthetase (AMP-forming)